MFRSRTLRHALSMAMLSSFLCLPALHAEDPELPAGPIQAKVRTACLECHESRIIIQQRLSKAAWIREVEKMVKWGAVVDPADKDAFVEYLSDNFPSDKAAGPMQRVAMRGKQH
jgi:hypothetical protein